MQIWIDRVAAHTLPLSGVAATARETGGGDPTHRSSCLSAQRPVRALSLYGDYGGVTDL